MSLRDAVIGLLLVLPTGAALAQQGQQQGSSPQQSSDESAMIKPPPDAQLVATTTVDEIRAFPEMAMKGKTTGKPQAEKVVAVQGVDRLFQTNRPFADAVSYFDQAFKQGGYEVQARVQTPSSVAWTVKRPDGSVANAVVRNTKPTTIELAEVGTAAMKVEPAR